MIRQITFNGVSTEDIGVTAASAKYSRPKPDRIYERAAFADGQTDFSRMDGKLHYAPREIEYTFNVIADSPEEAQTKLSMLQSWLDSDGDNIIYDDYFPDRCFTSAACDEISTPEQLDDAMQKYRVTAKFTADPYMLSRSGLIDEIYTFTPDSDSYTVWAAYANGRIIAAAAPTTTFTLSGVSVSSPTLITATIPSGSGNIIRLTNPKINGIPAITDVTSTASGLTLLRVTDDCAELIKAVTFPGMDISLSIDPQLVSQTSSVYSAIRAAAHEGANCPNGTIGSHICPDAEHLRLISAAEPSVRVNDSTADTECFSISGGMINTVTVSGSDLVKCRIEYNNKEVSI